MAAKATRFSIVRIIDAGGVEAANNSRSCAEIVTLALQPGHNAYRAPQSMQLTLAPGIAWAFSASAPKSRTSVKHRDGATILRPARDVVTHRNRTLLAVRDRSHPRGFDTARRQVVSHRLGATRSKGDVVFARAPFVRMAFDSERIAIVGGKPLRLLVEGAARLRGQIGRIGLEKDAVADIHHEVLLASGSCGAGATDSSPEFVRLVGAGRRNKRCR